MLAQLARLGALAGRAATIATSYNTASSELCRILLSSSTNAACQPALLQFLTPPSGNSLGNAAWRSAHSDAGSSGASTSASSGEGTAPRSSNASSSRPVDASRGAQKKTWQPNWKQRDDRRGQQHDGKRGPDGSTSATSAGASGSGRSGDAAGGAAKGSALQRFAARPRSFAPASAAPPAPSSERSTLALQPAGGSLTPRMMRHLLYDQELQLEVLNFVPGSFRCGAAAQEQGHGLHCAVSLIRHCKCKQPRWYGPARLRLPPA